MDEVRRLGALQGSEINEAKKVLAFEVTKLVHGEEEAQKAADAAAAEHAANEASCQLVTGENVRVRDEGEKERRAGNGKEGL